MRLYHLYYGAQINIMPFKLQAAIEFMIILGAFILFLSLMVHVALQKTSEVNQASDDLEAGQVLESASSKLNTALLEGDGFAINLSLPQKLRGRNYTINISNSFLYVNLSNTFYQTRLLASNISGSLRKGENMVSNRGSVLYIS